MTLLVGQHQQALLTDPQNGQTPIDADQVTANDNALRTQVNAHDNDATIHQQSSLLVDRPAAGTAGRFWVTSDGLRLYRDTGAAWAEVSYLPLAAGGTVAGSTTFSAGLLGNLVGNVTGNLTGNVTGDVTGNVSGNAGGNAATATLAAAATILATGRTINGVSFNGSANITVTASADTLTGSTLPALSGANLTALNGSNVASGTVAAARLGSGAAITTKFLRGDSQWITIPGGGDALTANTLAQFAATTSAQLAGVISDETGTGSLVFGTGPTITNATISGGLTLSSNALPNANNTIDLGSSILRWKDIWVAGDVSATTFNGALTGNVTGNVTGTVSGSAGSVAANALTGATLAAGVTASSLTSFGALTTFDVSTEYRKSGTKVVGARVTAFGPTFENAANKSWNTTGLNSPPATISGAAPISVVQELDAGMRAMYDALVAHGLIGA